MSARETLRQEMTRNHLYMTDERADELIDAFAHELAEKIQQEGAYWGERSAAGKVYRAAAKLIDPHLARAGLVRPDEEPTP